MSAQVTVSLDGQSRSVPRGTTVVEVLDGARGRDVVAARLNGKLVDLSRPLEDDATLEPVTADSPEGLDVLRHSTAHLMAQAVQSLYPGTQVTIGPTIEDGFFYDFAPPTPFTVDDLPKIEAKMRELAKADLKVERTEVARAEAIETLPRDGRALQGRDHQAASPTIAFRSTPGRLDGSVPRAARAVDRAISAPSS